MAHKQQPAPRDSGEGGLSLTHPVDSLRDLVGRMEGFFEKPLEMLGSALEPRLDIQQTPKELVVSVRLPGYEKKDLAVDLTEDSITVRGRRSSTRQTRRHGASAEQTEEGWFTRSMTLPAAIRPSDAKASYKDGRLEIRLPREKEAKVRRLGVE